MSHNKKISVVILGNGESLKKALITNVVQKDLSTLAKRNVLGSTVYENDRLIFICTPDLDTSRREINTIFIINRYPDMCLLVVEDGFSPERVWEQIDGLSRITDKPTEEFMVVLPFRHSPDDYPFKFITINQIHSKLAEIRPDEQNPNNPRFKIPPASRTSSVGKKEGRHAAPKVNLVLLGMSGAGKSASGNTILGKNVFRSKPSSNPVTTECQVEETQIDGTHVTVIDTPDVFNDDMRASVRNNHVKRCRELCGSGPCVFLLVLHVSRFTDGERGVMERFEKMFGNKANKQTVILFTRGNDLSHSGMSFEDFLVGCQPEQKKIIENCGNRCVLFENSHPGYDQVEELMEVVDSVSTQQKHLQKASDVVKKHGCSL